EKEQLLILEGIKLGKPITLNLDHKQLIRTKNSVMKETYLPVTTYQKKEISKARTKKKSVKIKLSAKQLEFINTNNKTGGFLPALVAALPAIAAASSIIKNGFDAYSNHRANNQLVEEVKKRYKEEKPLHKQLTDILEEPVKSGTGLENNEKVLQFINNSKDIKLAMKKVGKGLYLNPASHRKPVEGEGLYLNPASHRKPVEGAGVNVKAKKKKRKGG
ncbi:unnamed protein product, partial [Allacma fusca]